MKRKRILPFLLSFAILFTNVNCYAADISADIQEEIHEESQETENSIGSTDIDASYESEEDSGSEGESTDVDVSTLDNSKDNEMSPDEDILNDTEEKTNSPEMNDENDTLESFESNDDSSEPVSLEDNSELITEEDNSESAVFDDDSNSESSIGSEENVIESGLYFISTVSENPRMLCVKGNSGNENANVQLGSYVGSNVRIFDILKTDDTYYTIQNLHTGKYISVTEDGNVKQVGNVSQDAQKWEILLSDNGYNIKSLTGDVYLTCESNNISANVFTGINTTEWSLISTKKILGGGMLNCSYSSSVERKDGVTDIPSVSLSMYDRELVENVDYTVDFTEEGTSGVLTITGIGDYRGRQKYSVRVYEYYFDNGKYFITNADSGYMLSINGNSYENLANIQLGTKANSNVRMFNIYPFDDGYYKIQSFHSKKYLTAVSKNESANVRLEDESESALQLWEIIKNGNTYILKLKDSEKYLTASGNNLKANVCVNAQHQNWEITETRPLVSGAMVSYSYSKTSTFDYDTGQFSSPSVEIVLYGDTLEKDIDYTLSYVLDIANNKGTIKIKGINNYQGSKTLSYTLSVPENYLLSKLNISNYSSDNVNCGGNTYFISPKNDSSKTLKINNSYAKNGVKIIQSSTVNNTFSKFRFVYTGSGYKIISGNINYVLYEGSNGRLLTINKNISGKQRWTIISHNDGTYSILSNTSDYALTMDGDNVILYPYCAMDSQKFLLKETDSAWSSNAALEFSSDNYLSDTKHIWEFKLGNTDSVLYFTKEGYHAQVYPDSGICCNMKTGTLSVLGGFREFDADTVNIAKSVSLSDFGITPQTNRLYKLIFTRKNNMQITATLYDTVTGNKASVTEKYPNKDTGRGWGRVKTRVYGTALTYNSFRGYTNIIDKPTVGFIGDSYMEGRSLNSKYLNRYPTLVENMMGEKAAICAKGGSKSADGLKWLEEYYLDTYHPKYVVLGHGMNDTDYDLWQSNMEKMINLLLKNGITPILTTIPPGSSESQYEVKRKMSEWVMNSGFEYVDFEYIMTLNHDRHTKNTSAYLTDGVHPSVSSHKQAAENLISILS